MSTHYFTEKSTREQNNPTFAFSVSKVKILPQTGLDRTCAETGVSLSTLSQTPERKFPGHETVRSKRQYQKDRHQCGSLRTDLTHRQSSGMRIAELSDGSGDADLCFHRKP